MSFFSQLPFCQLKFKCLSFKIKKKSFFLRISRRLTMNIHTYIVFYFPESCKIMYNSKPAFWWKITIFADFKYVWVGVNVVKMAQYFTWLGQRRTKNWRTIILAEIHIWAATRRVSSWLWRWEVVPREVMLSVCVWK